jgi:cell division protein FtsW
MRRAHSSTSPRAAAITSGTGNGLVLLVLLSGLSLNKIGWSMAGGILIVILAYFFYPNATHRIDAFISGGSEFDQVDLAMRTLVSGGWSGSGLWLGTRKMALPEAHTDYIFSVIGEEFGLIACAALVFLFGVVVLRVLARASRETDPFIALALTGLVSIFGYQAAINMMVNVSLLPAKGMTLPFISYGGSSMISLGIGMGFLIAVTRKRPRAEIVRPVSAS